MRFRLNHSDGKYHVYSIACTGEVQEDLNKQGLDYWFVSDGTVFSSVDGTIVSVSDTDKIGLLKDYDVVEVYPSGLVSVFYEDTSGDAVFCVSDKCNSNCIMCPTGEETRRTGEICSASRLIELARHIPSDIEHITITGGEPFMMCEDIFPFLTYLRSRFLNTEFLFLTNGRALSIPEYCERLKSSVPNNICFGIPVHASSGKLHDRITQSKGSFEQTQDGVYNLLQMKMKVEIRIVVNKLNGDDMLRTAQLIADSYHDIDHVCIMAMEMTGNAYKNREAVWLPYKQAFQKIKQPVDLLMSNGIDVRLYNFPLCTVDPAYWTLCKKSITPYKIRYSESCTKCRMKEDCGGVFGSTFKFEEQELEPIL